RVRTSPPRRARRGATSARTTPETSYCDQQDHHDPARAAASHERDERSRLRAGATDYRLPVVVRDKRPFAALSLSADAACPCPSAVQRRSWWAPAAGCRPGI